MSSLTFDRNTGWVLTTLEKIEPCHWCGKVISTPFFLCTKNKRYICWECEHELNKTCAFKTREKEHEHHCIKQIRELIQQGN